MSAQVFQPGVDTAPMTSAQGTKAEEFNLWCAMNNRPFALRLSGWQDGSREWCIEADRGRPEAAAIWGTGTDEEAVATAIAYAFVAGIEWAEAERALQDADDEAEEGRGEPEVEWLDEDEFEERTDALRAGPPPLSTKIAGSRVAGQITVRLPEPDRPDFGVTESSVPEAEALVVDDLEPAPEEILEPAVAQPVIRSPLALEAEPLPDAILPPYHLPAVDLLGGGDPKDAIEEESNENELAEQAAKLETVLRNFRVRGEIMEVRPGPCVTLFELEPVPGTKSSTIINLADDIARSMSAVTARIALVPGRSVIGIELPNAVRETVYLKEILASEAWKTSKAKLPMALGKNIGGEPVVVDLARMPHLLIAGTTGSGKSVGINAMILSLLYHLPPEQCRLIMVDPKMLELSVYDDIPHLLTPVVTDPRKAVAALKWVVREMESRYKAMSLLGVRNLDGYNARVTDLNARGEQVTSRVQVGFDKERREPVFEDRIVTLLPLPFIVVVVDEMADLMLVAGKEIETLIQRLAQMARAAGIHLIMATQRPSVDVITGTIKANFPTRISFQVTSKIDSRTILGESGAEQLLGQGDMLFMQAGGRISRVHGPFVSDQEVEEVVAHLRTQAQPDYVYSVTEEDDDEEADYPGAGAIDEAISEEGDDGDLYSQALAVILREGKASVSFIQRHLQIGYNRAARLVERMENEGVISPPNHVGKREILVSARQYFAGRGDD
ncbi:DNA translocase FtsK [Rhodospirillum rubrum]|uniref:Cell divisionFtsK/SpoIIIE n=1 Tax=Rhodospirillum rubrum (strain ATCC 11170 / ATH 1.1.1 / DSM 467 / LMG 4362 / NCIMB 8255 / S1) TaxID=269796 RepID=Q2RSJ9_RHORT|nr:DNA translocase FtsK [Rhodospirillum rubrum]ABC22896.1 Cell divisionFtsK/SpoIIIE [Rhodospirillum rubrum ATCC 11170]AEO48619.1 cell division protein FtsK/SpoIIIE [Rhodospirillum rubrum F11]MBK5954501.1 DNA translocase FtsK [Rhodospirillum rubrum]QXG78883.1 DNA translocase FtsK [Rhodospirillum rubrum]HAP98782.1 DNA translocase FtsK [Rhodospirillum rubrum]